MAKIIYRRRYKTCIMQTLSTFIIICVIITSYLPVEMLYKIIVYAVLFILNLKLVIKTAEGDKLTSEQHKKLEEKRMQSARARVTEEKYKEVKQFVIDKQMASETLIERIFDLDYYVAKAIVERLVKEGIVGEAYDTSPRKVLVKKEEK